MLKYKVSVIVPVYNGEQFVENCCKQLIGQTLEDMQIVFVNDGSDDRTAEYIDRFASEYENVLALHQKNSGVSAARNKGISAAEGEYLGFVDVDDNYDEDMFEILYKAASENNLDIVCVEKVEKEFEILHNRAEMLKKLCMLSVTMSACTKIFRKELGAFFTEKRRIYEDMEMVYRMICKAESMGIVKGDKYHVNIREGSSSRAAVFSEKYFDAITVVDEMYDRLKTEYPDIIDYLEARKARTYLRISKIYYVRGKPKEYKGRIEELKKYLRSLKFGKLNVYFKKTDLVRYLCYLYCKPLFLMAVATFDHI